MTYQETAQMLAIISNHFPKILDGGESALKSWHYLLADIPFSKIIIATKMVLMSATYEPKPATIREAVDKINRTENARDKTSDEAWAEVVKKLNPYEKPNWSSKEIQEAVRTVGFQAMLNSPNIAYQRTAFVKSYEQLLARKKDAELVGKAKKLVELTASTLDANGKRALNGGRKNEG